MEVRGTIKGDNISMTWFTGNEKQCKKWISERDLHLFTYLVITDDKGVILEKIV